jgi:hypothetical protein
LRVPDAHAGKRIKCPGCGDPLRVPDPDAEAEAPPPKRAAPPAPPGMVRFNCPECDKQMQAKAEYAGRMTQCPGCKAQVEIPALEVEAEPEEEAEERVRAERPAPKRPAAVGKAKRAREEDEEPEDEEEERPRKKGKAKGKKKSKLPLILGGVALLLFVCCGIPGGLGLADYFFFNWVLGAPSDLAMVPANAQGFVSLRVADAWKLDLTQKQIRELRDKGLLKDDDDPAKEVEKKTGLTPAEVERVTVVFNDANLSTEKNLWVIVKTVKSYDKKKLQDKLKNSREKTHEGKAYFVGTLGDATVTPKSGIGKKSGPAEDQDAVYFASSKVVVYGPEAGIKSCLSFLAGKKPSGPLDDAIKLAGGSRYHLVAGFRIPSKMQKSLGDFTKEGPLKGVKPALDLESGSLAIKFGDSTQVELTARYASDAKAKDAKTALEQAKSAGQLLLPGLEDDLKQGLGAEKAKEALDGLKRALDSITVQQKGKDVVVKATLDTKGFSNLMPVPAKKGPFPDGPKDGKWPKKR